MEKMLGVMIDCSRSAVMKPETVKKYAAVIRKMGYNTLMLYTEDTYEIEGQPFFGHLRGRYTKNELKDIDAYCCEIGIELIPCIQTLAHLEHMFKWHKQYENINDCDNILLIGEEKTYELIEAMLSTVSECFTSKKIHIGMDEAVRVGTGRYMQKNGLKDRFDIINGHLHRVCKMAEKYSLEPMIWSDMFVRLALDVDDQYDEVDPEKIREKAALPENVSLVYWDYFGTDYDKYMKNLHTNKLFGRKVYFAGGAWTFKGIAPDNAYSTMTGIPAIKACNDSNIEGAFFTMWGDDGSECSKFAVLPALMYIAEASNGNTDTESIKRKFKEITGSDYDSFMLFDEFDNIGEPRDEEYTYGNFHACTSKYFLYDDLFMGIHEYKCPRNSYEYYKKLAEKIRNADGKGEYSYLFDCYEAFAEALAIKTELGVRTRKAYLENDKSALAELKDEYQEFAEKVRIFHEAFEKRWLNENKPHGFELHDIRLGGLIQRALSCKKRIEKFINGEIENIPELEEKVLAEVPFFDFRWRNMVTPGAL